MHIRLVLFVCYEKDQLWLNGGYINNQYFLAPEQYLWHYALCDINVLYFVFYFLY